MFFSTFKESIIASQRIRGTTSPSTRDHSIMTRITNPHRRRKTEEATAEDATGGEQEPQQEAPRTALRFAKTLVLVLVFVFPALVILLRPIDMSKTSVVVAMILAGRGLFSSLTTVSWEDRYTTLADVYLMPACTNKWQQPPLLAGKTPFERIFCALKGGTPMEYRACIIPNCDAGRPCTDSSQCVGSCYAGHTSGGAGPGVCDAPSFGCFAEVRNGVVDGRMVCIDP